MSDYAELLARLDSDPSWLSGDAAEVIRSQAARIAVLEEALRFYADAYRYEPVDSFHHGIGFVHGEIHDRDRGEVAQQALRTDKEEKGK